MTILVARWTLANRLTLNFDKSNYMLFMPEIRNRPIIDLNLAMNNIKISKVSSTKFLGVIIDENLTWKTHIEDLCSSVRKYIGIFFYKLRYIMPPVVLKTLYFALVYPRLLYGIIIYANTFQSYYSDLITLNNRLLRILQFKELSSSTAKLYLEYNTLPVDQLFVFQLLMHTFNILNNPNMLPEIFQRDYILNSDIHSYNTRSTQDLHRTQTISSYGARISYSLSSKYWNSLPPKIKNVKTLSLAKKEFVNFVRDLK